MNFSKRLSEAIEYRGVSQKWLADKSNTTEATISRYMNGKASPAILEILHDIAVALNVSADYLIGITNLPQSKESISEEEKVIISVWSKVSAEDKQVFYALLNRYLSPDERAILLRGDKR